MRRFLGTFLSLGTNAFLAVCLTVMVLLGFISAPLHAQIYQWEDEDGGIHFSDDPTQVPENKRSKKKKFTEENDSITTLKSSEPQRAPSTDATPLEGAEKQGDKPSEKAAPAPKKTNAENPEKEEYWQDKMSKTQKELEDAQNELDQLDNARRKNLESGPGMQARQAEYAERETQLKSKIETLQKDVDETIPDQARRAGIPPGALR